VTQPRGVFDRRHTPHTKWALILINIQIQIKK